MLFALVITSCRFEIIHDDLPLLLLLSLLSLLFATVADAAPNHDEVNDNTARHANYNEHSSVALVLSFRIVSRNFRIVHLISRASTHRLYGAGVVLSDEPQLVYSVLSLGAVEPDPAPLLFEIGID